MYRFGVREYKNYAYQISSLRQTVLELETEHIHKHSNIIPSSKPIAKNHFIGVMVNFGKKSTECKYFLFIVLGHAVSKII